MTKKTKPMKGQTFLTSWMQKRNCTEKPHKTKKVIIQKKKQQHAKQLSPNLVFLDDLSFPLDSMSTYDTKREAGFWLRNSPYLLCASDSSNQLFTRKLANGQFEIRGFKASEIQKLNGIIMAFFLSLSFENLPERKRSFLF